MCSSSVLCNAHEAALSQCHAATSLHDLLHSTIPCIPLAEISFSAQTSSLPLRSPAGAAADTGAAPKTPGRGANGPLTTASRATLAGLTSPLRTPARRVTAAEPAALSTLNSAEAALEVALETLLRSEFMMTGEDLLETCMRNRAHAFQLPVHLLLARLSNIELKPLRCAAQ